MPKIFLYVEKKTLETIWEVQQAALEEINILTCITRGKSQQSCQTREHKRSYRWSGILDYHPERENIGSFRVVCFFPNRNLNWGNWENLVKVSRWANSLACLVAQSCPTPCNPMDCSPPGSSVHGILQAGILEWVTTPSSRGSSQLRDRTQVSCIAGRFFTIWATREAHINVWTRV